MEAVTEHNAVLGWGAVLWFSRNEALSAIMVTDNEQVELAGQCLLTVSKMEYERAKRQHNQPNRHWTIIEKFRFVSMHHSCSCVQPI